MRFIAIASILVALALMAWLFLESETPSTPIQLSSRGVHDQEVSQPDPADPLEDAGDLDRGLIDEDILAPVNPTPVDKPTATILLQVTEFESQSPIARLPVEVYGLPSFKSSTLPLVAAKTRSNGSVRILVSANETHKIKVGGKGEISQIKSDYASQWASVSPLSENEVHKIRLRLLAIPKLAY